MSTPDDSVGVCKMVPDRIIPVIFVPGVMGSNLIGNGEDNRGETWLVNSAWSMKGWLVTGPEGRKRILRPEIVEVYDGGALPEGTALPEEELRRRHWGEIAAMSYGPALVWLENALNDFENYQDGERLRLLDLDLGALTGEAKPTRSEVALSYRYRFPVYACGYNWLASNADSGKRLSDRIDEIVRRYVGEKKKCEKVIVITHSMGGLVGRHCSEVLGRKSDILGIVHGVMPAIGAAAVYRRYKSGTEGSYGTSLVLGSNAAEMTAVLSSAPGPMQLLPTPEYGNGWLTIKDGAKEYRLPEKGDPYGEIYTVRGKWWSMCQDELMNPLNKESDSKKKQAQVEADWEAFTKLIRIVERFHELIKQKYHTDTHAFFGNSDEHRAYGTVTWTGDGGGWWRGDRDADVLDAKPVYSDQISTKRTVDAELKGKGWTKTERQTYKISKPDEAGDGTVPLRSGIAPRDFCKSLLQVVVEHEPAFKAGEGADNLRACRFTVRAIVKIAQDIQATALRYD